MKFLDNITIDVKAGNGGDGIASFRREKFIEYGGPNGGDGGKGGDVIFLSKENLNTLVDFRYKKIYKAGNGKNGGSQQKTGAYGEDLVLYVPIGTQIISQFDEVLFDFKEQGQKYTLAVGGNGGFGNYNFKSSTNRAPRHFTKGKPGEEFTVTLQLKLIADIGIIGMPNAGKSTFLATMTNAKPKVANYPFTTLNPNLGIYRSGFNKEIIFADIPGLIDGAHNGMGLGDKFLAHVERCKILLHFVDNSSDDPAHNYKVVRDEINLYKTTLSEKSEIIVLTKSDINAEIPEFFKNKKVFVISCFSKDGIDALMKDILVCDFNF